MSLNKLTHSRIKAAQWQGKDVKLSDGGGLYLHVMPTKKIWRVRYRDPATQKEQTLTIGEYPLHSLAEAREARDEARKQIQQGINPALAKKAVKNAQGLNPHSFKAVALDYIEHYKQKTRPITHKRNVRRLEMHAFPSLADRDIREITSADILALISTLADTPETQSRVKTLISQVFNHAIAIGRADTNPTLALRGYTKPIKRKHRPGLTDPSRLGKLLRDIDGIQRGNPSTKLALQLAPLVFWRTNNLRFLRWEHIDWDNSYVLFSQAKVDDSLLTPLSRQARAILKTAHNIYGHRSEWVFPSKENTPISDNTLNHALHSLGYKGQQTVNGFRPVAQTLLIEKLGYPLDYTELQLGHKPPGKYGEAYNRSQWRKEREEMMQRWADYLDELKAQAS